MAEVDHAPGSSTQGAMGSGGAGGGGESPPTNLRSLCEAYELVDSKFQVFP
jgi:hypothetical protein